MRFIPVANLKGGEILAVNIINANMMILMSENSILTEKTITRIRKYGIHSIYIKDPEMNKYYTDNLKSSIDSGVRNNSVHNIKDSFTKFHDQLKREKRSMKYGNSGLELFDGVKNISKNLIDELIQSKGIQISMVDIKNATDYHYEHSVSVAIFSLIIGLELGLSMPELENLAYAALLIDVGCNWIDKDILLSENVFTEDEFIKVQAHVAVGYDYITNNTTFNAHIKSILMHHHERIDGSGYPKGLNSDDIHPLAKIIMVADVYDAMTSDRPHRKAHNQHEAFEYILANAGKLFDFKIASIFTKKIVPYPVGTYVLLSNGQKGVVIENTSNHPLRPTVRTFGKSSYTSKSSFQLNLLEANNVIIEKVIYHLT